MESEGKWMKSEPPLQTVSKERYIKYRKNEAKSLNKKIEKKKHRENCKPKKEKKSKEYWEAN